LILKLHNSVLLSLSPLELALEERRSRSHLLSEKVELPLAGRNCLKKLHKSALALALRPTPSCTIANFRNDERRVGNLNKTAVQSIAPLAFMTLLPLRAYMMHRLSR